ncbi:MAG: hypothetical protein HY791_00865 [Deltaproteobacteria bacterium]|nr:hypothetical protein [Deltaproteobacteria bacterium]
MRGGKNEPTWHNFADGAANLLLGRVLERELGGEVVSRNTSPTFKGDAAKSTNHTQHWTVVGGYGSVRSRISPE